MSVRPNLHHFERSRVLRRVPLFPLGGDALVARLVDGDGPGDASEFVGEGDSGAVVSAAQLEAQSPGLEAVGVFGSCGGEQDGSGAVAEEGAQVGVTAAGDGADVAAWAAGILLRDDA